MTHTQPPAEAARSLLGIVSARKDVDETVVAFLLNDILSKAENLDEDAEVKFGQVRIVLCKQQDIVYT